MIPNVCITWCRRVSECQWCHEDINAGDPTVMVFFWNKGSDGHRWNVKKFYHVNNSHNRCCWIEQGLDHLKLNPYQPLGNRGPKSDLTPEIQILRKKLIGKRSSLIQRKKNLKTPWPQSADMIASIDNQLAGVILEISEVGGIPKSWVEDLLR